MAAEPGRLSPGATLGSYRIERLLGRGGMGAVFLAYDSRLHRNVALKVIDDTAGDAAAGARLLREARSAAALTHPHICTIHEVGEADGTSFIAMEYASGRTLRAVLDEAPLALGHALRLGIQAADALGYAHERGVVHRDLKAANAIVDEDGRLTIIDFGLARRADALMSTATTQGPLLGVAADAGTPYAMAPEQIRGQPVDERTDIWALGVLLYEMVAAAKPFAAVSAADLFVSILTAAPAAFPATVPRDLRAVIERCLEKEPDRRYQRAADVRAALSAIEAGASVPRATRRGGRTRWLALAGALVGIAVLAVAVNVGGLRDRLAGAPTSIAPIRLAVLPFTNLARDPEQEYFSDGLTDDMITQLGRLHPQRLSVIARTSSMQYKGRSAPIEEVGRELDVDYVLEGTARREGTRVRINATLIRIRDRSQQWAGTYDRELAGILAVQNEVARGVAQELAFALLPAEEARLANAPAVNPEAYEAYLRGLFHADKLTRQDLDLAQQYFESALAHDPGYAPAYAGLALVWAGRNQLGYVAPSDAIASARVAATAAIRLDDALALAHYALASVAWTEWDWDAVEAEVRRAIEINPNDARPPALYAHVLIARNRTAEAISYAAQARALDPLSAFNQSIYGTMLYFDGRYEDAITALQTALRMAPDLPIAHCGLWYSYYLTGRFEQALRGADGCIGHYDPSVGAALLEEGGYTEAMRRVASRLAAGFDGVYVAPIDVMTAYLHAGDTELAFDWLVRSVDARDPNMFAISTEPLIRDKLGADPRFGALLRRVGLSL
jgi:TolB-like protein/Tfp pilus assembly protein PilF